MADEDDYYPPVSPMAAGMGGKCPRCGQGALYDGFLKLKTHCPSCGLDYAKADTGDGPAVFVIFITGFVGVLFAFILRFMFGAPAWLVLLLAFAITIGLTFMLLRPMKATLVALQYRNKAAEGRVDEE
ncbi:DUF983 domain-containing protein [Parvularcula marina]|uniref:DUF983 domain-containing protein n=1 Tax=Parvularcula marina TaxID=2292771 RepID=A0A371RHG4_9PROT|nr:DUF983 domain-containing protein [Parvularcula marina]RFB04889.1 DUF983 domain-containing protein [Parvularcula marina]